MTESNDTRLILRPETPADIPAIAALTTAAFAGAEHSSGTEAAIVDALRGAGALTLSLVAEDGDGQVLGHAAFSPVTIDGEDQNWFGLGPVSVAPELQGQGIGAALIADGLAQLRTSGAAGCVVLGDPAYYGRFGFVSDAGLTYPGVPAEYFQRLVLNGAVPTGTVTYHAGFAAL